MPHAVQLEVVDQQSQAIDLPRLLALWQQAAAAILQLRPGPLGSSLAALDEVTFVLLDDAHIAAIHAEFLEDPTPTDVITFHHGEILVSTETATRAAAEEATSTFAEVLLYGIHGLAHLHGYDDQTTAQREQMEQLQSEIIARLDHDESAT